MLSPADALGCSSDQRPHAAPKAAQQLAELESKVAAADTHITRLQLELDICGAEQQAAEQAASVKREQQAAAWEELLQVVEQLHSTQQLTDAAR